MTPENIARAETIREMLTMADESFIAARRAISTRQRTEIDEILVMIDGKIDEAEQLFRNRSMDHAHELLIGVKISLRKLCGVQTEGQRMEVEYLLRAAREATDALRTEIEDMLRAEEYGELAERMLKQAAIKEAAEEERHREMIQRHLGVVAPVETFRQPRFGTAAWLALGIWIVLVLAIWIGSYL